MKEGNLKVWLRKKSFDKLMEKYLDNLMQLAYMRCANKELAEDLVQDTCLKAYKSYMAQDKTEYEKPKAWLFKILINTHIDFTRKKQLATVNIEDLDFAGKEDPAKNAQSNVFFKDLDSALQKIEPEQREVVYLSDVTGYSYKEMAEILSVPLGTIMSRLHRARQNLRKLLSDKGYSKEYIKSGEKS